MERADVSSPQGQNPAGKKASPGPVPTSAASQPAVSPDQAGRQAGAGRLQSAWRTGADGRTTFRLMPPLVLWWCWLVFAVVNILDLAIQSHDRFSLQVIVAILFITGLMYACALRPRVITDTGGISVLNPFREFRVPWGGVTGIFVGDSVEVGCEQPEPKPEKTIYSWALYSPRRARARAEMRVGPGTGRARQRYDARSVRRWGVSQSPDRTTYGKMPSQAKDMASKHPSHIMATELARRCDAARGAGPAPGTLSARWSWLPLAAVLVPLAALVVVILVK